MGTDGEFVVSGHLRLARSESDLAALEAYAQLANPFGLDLQLMSGPTFRRRYPWLGAAVRPVDPPDGLARGSGCAATNRAFPHQSARRRPPALHGPSDDGHVPEYLHEHGEKRVYGQMVVFEDRRGTKMFERYGFKVMNRAEITKYRDLHPTRCISAPWSRTSRTTASSTPRRPREARPCWPGREFGCGGALGVLLQDQRDHADQFVGEHRLENDLGVDALQEGIHLRVVVRGRSLKEKTRRPVGLGSSGRRGKTCRRPSSA